MFLLRRILAVGVVVIALVTGCFAAQIREYFLAAEDVSWDYAPSGRNLMHAAQLPAPWNNQTRWKKTRYFEYMDASFSVKKVQPEWLGILGPIIRAEVGDTVVVHFLNRSSQPHSVHPHGLRYDKANEGAHYLPGGAGASVAPGGRFTYRWLADKTSGPGPEGPSSVVWWYHSHVEAEKEINAGLLGPIIVTARGKAKPDGSPKDVDREFVTLFMIFNETGRERSNPADNTGMFHSINGYIFSNLPGLVMKNGEKVRWHLLGMGNEEDLHTPHWHGKVVQYGSRNTDVVELLPGSMVTVDMEADNPGTWMFHCHVLDHMEAGMMATYTIYQPPRFCPVQMVPLDWQQLASTAEIRIKNISSKPIRRVEILSALLVTPAQLQPLPFFGWSSNQPIDPNQERTLRVYQELFHNDKALGPVFFPSRVVYQDGSEWKPEKTGDCFTVYWRDKQHPELETLPPFQFLMKED
jgi:FtsP/CotA-like multicopper oxidase with cupredoxin domain